MAYLRVTITATIPLPRSFVGAANIGACVGRIALETEAALRLWPKAVAHSLVLPIDEDQPGPATDESAPATPRRGRKPRAALGSSPLAPKRELTDEEKRSEADLRAAAAFMHPPTTGADGEDLLAIPPHLVRS